MNYWLMVGSEKNWSEAFAKGNIWGLGNRQRKIWEEIREFDIVLFYVTRPISGVIGYGTIKTKFKQTEPLWDDELKAHKVLWPLRFEFSINYCIPQDKWTIDKITSELIRFKAGVGFGRIPEHIAKDLIAKFEVLKNADKDEEPLHEDIKKKLIEIGQLQNYIAEPEYKFDLGRIDVVWRRVEKSVPTYVFEIIVKGDLYHAISKLKHAYDLWNSRIFIVADKFDEEKVKELLSGTFHEIREQLKFINIESVNELYSLKIKLADLERKLGL